MTEGLPRVARSTTADRFALASWSWILRMLTPQYDHCGHISDEGVRGSAAGGEPTRCRPPDERAHAEHRVSKISYISNIAFEALGAHNGRD